MLDRLRDYSRCLAEKHRWAVATIIDSSGSVPRPVGTSMAIRDDMTTIGSVSGGCVEAALVETARQCLEQDVSAVERFGYADDDAIAIGLMCGGDITVFVQPLAHVAASLQGLHDCETAEGSARSDGALVRALPQGEKTGADPDQRGTIPVAVAVGTDQDSADEGPTDEGPIGETALHRLYGHAATQILSVISSGRCAVVDVRDEEDPACPIVGQVFVESVQQRSRVLIYGASDYSAAIADAARMLGRHVTVCDARAVFATSERHPSADEVVVRIPAEHFREQWESGQIDQRTAVLVMTHDTRFDIPLLHEALHCDLGYIGALGSRTTNERRLRDLAERGLAERAQRRLHAPVGLDIGARTPHEVAISVFAEIIAEENGRAESVGPVSQLRFGDGPIHAYGPPGVA